MLTLLQNVWICRQYLIFGKKSFIKIINHLLLSKQWCGRFHYIAVKDIECKICFWTDCHVTPKAFEEEQFLSVFSQRFIPWSVFFFLKIYLLIDWLLCWVFVSVLGFSLVASGGHSSSRCAGLSLSQPLLLRSTSSRRAGSVVVAHGPSCSVACGIFPDQGSNPCPPH